MKFTRVTDKEILFQNCFYRDDVLIDPIITQNYRIIQAADSHYLSDFAISEHRQVCDVEITYVQYNEMKISIGSDAAVCKRGDTHLVFKGETHGLIGVGSCRFQTLAFDILEGSPMRALLDDLTRAYGDPNARSVSLAGIEEQVREALLDFADIYVDYLNSLDYEKDEGFNDLHMLFGACCALAELQTALPGKIITEKPLRLVLDRRPFI